MKWLRRVGLLLCVGWFAGWFAGCTRDIPQEDLTRYEAGIARYDSTFAHLIERIDRLEARADTLKRPLIDRLTTNGRRAILNDSTGLILFDALVGEFNENLVLYRALVQEYQATLAAAETWRQDLPTSGADPDVVAQEWQGFEADFADMHQTEEALHRTLEDWEAAYTHYMTDLPLKYNASGRETATQRGRR